MRDNETLNLHEEICDTLTTRGFQPKLHILDNDAFRELKKNHRIKRNLSIGWAT